MPGSTAWQERLEKVGERIERLGPINLVAIEEFQEYSQRKEYLDKQNEDLTQALTALEEAIRKIDRETRTRFKETFDKVNEQLQGILSQAVRRRQCLYRTDRTGSARIRRGSDGAPAGQAQQHHSSVVGRRKGADGGGADLRDLRAQPGAVLPAG